MDLEPAKPRDYDNDAEELRQRLPPILEWARVRRGVNEDSRRAFIVEFGGMPKSGKSSTIETIRHFFSHGPKPLAESDSFDKQDREQFKNGFRVDTPAEGVSLRTPNYLRSNQFDYNTWAGAYALQELLQASHDRYNHIVILDRGPWDASCWLQHWMENPPAKVEVPTDCRKIVEFLSLPAWMTLADLHVVFVVDPSAAAQRERDKRLIKHDGAASKKSLMESMWRIYNERFETLQKIKKEECSHVGVRSALLIDTTKRENTQKAVALKVIEGIFSVLEAKIDHRWADQDITPDNAKSLFKSYLSKMIVKEKSHISQYIANSFVPDFNKLPYEKRRGFLREVREAYLVGEPSLLNRAALNESQRFIGKLEQLLKVTRAGR